MRTGCLLFAKKKVFVIMGYWWYWLHAKPEIPDLIPPQARPVRAPRRGQGGTPEPQVTAQYGLIVMLPR
jgi:hypothetical protein